MTILVGMAGSDGVVLAADGRMVRPASHAGECDQISTISKITHLPEHHVAYAAAGDFIAWRAGHVLSEALDNRKFDFARIQRSLQNVGLESFEYEREAIKRVYADADDQENRGDLLAQTKDSTPRGLLIVFHGPNMATPQLWGLSLQSPTPFAHPLKNAVYGAIGNLARFFGAYFVEQMPIGKLQFLAAHTVLTAHRFDSLMIEGLEVALFDQNGYRTLGPEKLSALRHRSGELDAVIRNRLYDGPDADGTP